MDAVAFKRVLKSQGGKKMANPWLVHVKKVKAANPKMSLTQVLKKAKLSYVKKK